MQSDAFFTRSWRVFAFDPALADWIREVLPTARRAVQSPENARWLRCGGTWFVGVNALPNDEQGAVGRGPALRAKVTDFIHRELGIMDFTWDRAQLSVCYPGYPKPMESESKRAFRYRLERDAAHIDGLLAEGAQRRRHLREHHGFILGIPMVESSRGASPFVVWEGSHEIVRETFSAHFGSTPSSQWGHLDITEVYHDLRRRIFDTCKRVEVWAKPGQSYLVHRLALHGMAPWRQNGEAPADGRMICYFRPEVGGPRNWLADP